MVNPFQAANQRQEQERRERIKRWQRWNDRRTAQGINQAQADPNILAQPTIIPTATGDIRRQYPMTSPTIPPQQQATFTAGQQQQRPANLPLGIQKNVYGTQAQHEERGKPEFGSGFGSGLLENAARMGLGALENVQKGIETFGGAAVRGVGAITPGDLLGYESTLKQLKEERGGGPGFWNVAGQAQLSAEAFRRTDMPSVNVDIIPGKGINLPGSATFNRVDIGVKGAIELLPDAILAAFTGGTALGRGVATKGVSKVARGIGRGALGAVGGDIVVGAARSANRSLRKLRDTVPEVSKNPRMASPQTQKGIEDGLEPIRKESGFTYGLGGMLSRIRGRLLHFEAPEPGVAPIGTRGASGEYVPPMDTKTRVDNEQSTSLMWDLINRSPEKLKGPLTWTINRIAGHNTALDTSNRIEVAVSGNMRNMAMEDQLVLYAHSLLLDDLGFTAGIDLANLRLAAKGAGHSEEQLGMLAKKVEAAAEKLRKSPADNAGEILGMEFTPGGLISLKPVDVSLLSGTPIVPLEIPLTQLFSQRKKLRDKAIRERERFEADTDLTKITVEGEREIGGAALQFPKTAEGLPAIGKSSRQGLAVTQAAWQGAREFRTIDGVAWNKVMIEFFGDHDRTVSKFADMAGFKPIYRHADTGEEIVGAAIPKVREVTPLPKPGFTKLGLHQPAPDAPMRWKKLGETGDVGQGHRSVTAGGRIVEIHPTYRDDFHTRGSTTWSVFSTKYVNGKLTRDVQISDHGKYHSGMSQVEAKAWASDNVDAQFANISESRRREEIIEFIENDAVEFIPTHLGGPQAARKAIEDSNRLDLYPKLGLEKYDEMVSAKDMDNAIHSGFVPDYAGLDRRTKQARLAERNTKIANFAFRMQNSILEMSQMMMDNGVLELKLLKNATKRNQRGIEQLRFGTDLWIPRMVIPGTRKTVDAFSWLANQGHDANNFGVNMGRVGVEGSHLKPRNIDSSEITELITDGYVEYADPFRTHENFMRGGYRAIREHYMERAARSIAKGETDQIVNWTVGSKVARSALATLQRTGKAGKKGEIKPETIKKLENSGFSTFAKRIEKLNDLDMEKRLEGLADLKDVLRKEKIKLQDTFYSPNDYSRTKIPFFAGMLFKDKRELDNILGMMGQGKPGFIEKAGAAFSEFADTSRLGKTGFDVGFHLIQGLPALGFAASTILQNPAKGKALFVEWKNSMVRTYEGMVNPEAMTRQIIENLDVLEEAISQGRLQLSRNATDIFRAVRGETTFARIPKVGKEMDDLIRTMAKPFERAFIAPGDLLRIEYYKVMREEVILREGQEGLAKLGSFLNKMTGALNPLDQGVRPSQSAIERNILFFSQRYTRASLGMLKSFFEGGIEGEMARRSITGMAGLGLLTYWGLTEAMKAAGMEQETNLDPSKSDFMTFKIGDDLVGVGSFWTQFARLTGKLSQTTWDEEAQGDFGSMDDNPIVRWIRGRASPSGGIAWDGLTSSDYLGRKLANPVDWTKHLGKSVVPIWMEAAFLDSPYKTGPVATLGEMVGGRIRPLSASERRSNLRDEIAVELYDAKWHDLNKLQQQRIRNFHDVSNADAMKLEELDIIIRQGRDARADELETKMDSYWDRKQAIEKQWKYSIATGNAAMEDGFITPGQFKKIYLEPANAERRSRMENELYGSEFADVIQHFQESSERFGVDHPEDVAYAEYIDSVIANPDFEDVDGFDFRARGRAEDAFKMKWGDEVYTYVQEIFNEGRELPVAVYEFYQGKKHFDYYWKDTEEATLQSSPNSEVLTGLWDRWLDIDNSDDRKVLEAEYPILITFQNKIARVRKEMRKQNAQLELWLYRWGYIDPRGPLQHVDNQWEGVKSYARTSNAMPLNAFGIVPGIRG